jgi:hypothetical protein
MRGRMRLDGHPPEQLVVHGRKASNAGWAIRSK